MEEMVFSVAEELVDIGMNAYVEGGGASIPFVQVDLSDGRRIALGDAGGDWSADVYLDDNAMSYGDVFESFGVAPANSSSNTIALRFVELISSTERIN